MIYVGIGIGLILMAVILEVVKYFKKKQSSSSNHEPESVLRQDLSPAEKFETLQAGAFVEFSPDLTRIPMKEYRLTGTGVLQGLSGAERNFTPNSGQHQLFILGKGDYILINFNDGEWVALDQEIPLVGEAANEFNSYGENFSKGGQVPGSISFVWQDMNLSIQDVGYLEFHQKSGTSEIPDGTKIKFLLAKRGDGAIFYLENRKTGPDCVRIGQNLGRNLEKYLGNILN